jgi:hypothetical protein
MFKHPKVVPITAAKLESKEQVRTETIHAIPTGMVTRMAIRQMLAAAAHDGRSFTCPGAAVTTAATPSHAFPIAAAEICKGTHS